MSERVEPLAVKAEVKDELLVRRRHRRQPPRENDLQRLWRRRHWEIAAALAVVAGIFLAAGPLAHWAQPGRAGGEPVDLLALYIGKITSAIGREMDRAAAAVWRFMLLSNWAVKLGYVLLAFAVVVIPLRARWWLLHESPWLRMCCPRCGSTQIHRVHRQAWERLVSKIVPVRRYCCSECRWRGTRIDRSGHVAPSTTLASSRH